MRNPHRNETGSRVDAVDFDLPLADVLDKLGVTRQVDTESPQKRKWSISGRYLGCFDAHEAWSVLRHYNRIGNWDIAVHEAQCDLHHGYNHER